MRIEKLTVNELENINGGVAKPGGGGGGGKTGGIGKRIKRVVRRIFGR